MRRNNFEGIVAVDKPQGPTSHDIVAHLRRLLGMRRIGHCGTLDPLATGVLVVCLGRFTRLNPWLSAGKKEYLTTFALGAVSSTEDAQGDIQPLADAPVPPREVVEENIKGFIGAIEQVPPAHSAVRVNGVRSYVLARQKKAVPLEPRLVQVAAFEILAYDYPTLKARIVCSRGTYIRALARDLGAKLGCGAYMQDLCRTRVGALTLDDAHTLEGLDELAAQHSFERALVGPRRALADMPHLDLDRAQAEVFVHGGRVDLTSSAVVGECAVWRGDQEFCGIGRRDSAEGLKPVKVLCNTEDHERG